jgi:hypothetical protein
MHSWTKEEQFLQHAAAPIQFTDRALTLPDFLPQPARHRIRRRRAVVAGGAQSALCGCGVFEITQNRTYGGRLETGAIDPMYGPAVRCKKISSNWRRRSCINVSGLRLERVVLRAIMDISARAF